MNCIHCGKTQPENAVFCPFCGKPRTSVSDRVRNEPSESGQPPAAQAAEASVSGPSAVKTADRQRERILPEDRDPSKQPYEALMRKSSIRKPPRWFWFAIGGAAVLAVVLVILLVAKPGASSVLPEYAALPPESTAAQAISAPESTPLQAPEEAEFYIGYVGHGDETYILNVIFREAIMEFTDKYILHYATDAAMQPFMIENDMIPAGVDGIIVIPYDIEAIKPALQKAEEAGITTIAMSIEQSGIDSGYMLIPVDPYLMGKNLGERFAQLLGGKGNVVIRCTFLEKSFFKTCLQGASDALSGYPDIHILEVLDDSFNFPDYATTAAIQTYGEDLSGILALDPLSMDGCADSAQGAGLSGKIVVFGYGALSSYDYLLSTGVVSSFFAEDFEMSAKAAVRLLYELASGNTIREGTDLGIPGFHNLKVNGNAIIGENWIEVK